MLSISVADEHPDMSLDTAAGPGQSAPVGADEHEHFRSAAKRYCALVECEAFELQELLRTLLRLVDLGLALPVGVALLHALALGPACHECDPSPVPHRHRIAPAIRLRCWTASPELGHDAIHETAMGHTNREQVG